MTLCWSSSDTLSRLGSGKGEGFLTDTDSGVLSGCGCTRLDSGVGPCAALAWVAPTTCVKSTRIPIDSRQDQQKVGEISPTFLARYRNSASTCCWVWLAWASAEIPVWFRMENLVKFAT